VAVGSREAGAGREGEQASDQLPACLRGGTEVRWAVGPAHLEGAGENKVGLRVPRPARELKDEMVFVAGGNGHAPETIREIDFLPMDDPIVRGVVHEVEKFWEHRAQGLDRVLVGGGAGGVVDRRPRGRALCGGGRRVRRWIRPPRGRG
jgi:hypothetical protein